MAAVQETRLDEIGTALFDAFYDTSFEGELDFPSVDSMSSLDMSLPSRQTSAEKRMAKKRKSLDWNSRPLEPKVIKRKRGRPRKVKPSSRLDLIIEPIPFSFEDDIMFDEASDLQFLSELFLDREDVKPVTKELMKARKSEDWSSRPLETTSKRRSKWSEDELHNLWEGIAKFGNSWTDIRSMLATRSYCQIKDKGRRCLFLLGWETGRTKEATESSSISAKKLAKSVLEKMNRIN